MRIGLAEVAFGTTLGANEYVSFEKGEPPVPATEHAFFQLRFLSDAAALFPRKGAYSVEVGMGGPLDPIRFRTSDTTVFMAAMR